MFRTHDTSMLDPVSKRKATICNLFATHRMPMKDIARVLDEEYVRIIQVILGEWSGLRPSQETPGADPQRTQEVFL